ncbi:DISARM system phospholipase D-like protein DrmC [Polyangium fumosum]|uniref:Phospholipase n=1 Tax=Polyangium fumosum TaxID=889272 RepID=A0A4U1IUT4_9BACT|nr:DISARM system phospholipase D-like protein DrmC [Polyangium fumosum]TKC98161.1 phospholipase [Polyangium fumosum]
MGSRASFKTVATTVLVELREAIASGFLKTPVDRAALIGFGIRLQIEAIEGALAGHKSAACVAILDVALAEREDRRKAPELVWTGPEAPAGAARDTAVVLRALFEGARESVLLAGYSFDHAKEVLAPLHRVMQEYGVSAQFFVDIPQIARGVHAGVHLERCFGEFLRGNWPFGEPRPKLYYDKRAVKPGPPYCSLHAKCVVVDGVKAFVSSANFTQRGQERNIEVGVLIEDPGFAGYLAGQWVGLIEGGMVGEYGLV